MVQPQPKVLQWPICEPMSAPGVVWRGHWRLEVIVPSSFKHVAVKVADVIPATLLAAAETLGV